MQRITLGISACLLGHRMRYDGADAEDRFITGTLGEHFDWVGVCPEVECGLSVPREAMRLEGDPADPVLITKETRIEHTPAMKRWAARKTKALATEGISGFIFKSRSPSCEPHRVKVYGHKGNEHAAQNGATSPGLFARAFIAANPLVPVIDEAGIGEPVARQRFISSASALARWQGFVSGAPRRAELQGFHAAQKLVLMAHSPEHYRSLGKLVADPSALPKAELFATYAKGMMEAMSHEATPGKHENVLQHMLGYFKEELRSKEKAALLDLISRYRKGEASLMEPLSVIRHYATVYDEQYLLGQAYLTPHPVELI